MIIQLRFTECAKLLANLFVWGEIMSRRFFYSGDVNIEHGGVFYCLDSWKLGYVDALRVTPCSDAGGPDNIFWIEELTVNIREGTELDRIFACVGMYHKSDMPKGASYRHAMVDAHIYYGAYDIESSYTVQIGPDDEFYDGREKITPDYFLRASVNLRKLARRMATGGAPSNFVKPLERKV
jgi:hypothetical protein